MKILYFTFGRLELNFEGTRNDLISMIDCKIDGAFCSFEESKNRFETVGSKKIQSN